MARDYARGSYNQKKGKKRRKNSSRKVSRSKQKNTSGRRLFLFAGILITGVLIGLFIAGLSYLNHHKSHSNSVNKETNIHTVHTQSHHTRHKKVANKPHFDFYTILQNKSVETPENTKQEIKNSKQQDMQYILQVASVRNPKDADRLRAQLILLGYQVFITQSHAGKIAWHRVNIGPFKTLDEAEHRQDELRKNKINSLLLKRRV